MKNIFAHFWSRDAVFIYIYRVYNHISPRNKTKQSRLFTGLLR